MRKIFRKIHLWLTIPFGLFIFTLFLTGAILVFQKDIIASANTGGWIYSIGWENPQPFFKSVLRLHRWLFDIPADKSQLTLGRAIVGISTNCYRNYTVKRYRNLDSSTNQIIKKQTENHFR